jgi:hypothetical protein
MHVMGPPSAAGSAFQQGRTIHYHWLAKMECPCSERDSGATFQGSALFHIFSRGALNTIVAAGMTKTHSVISVRRVAGGIGSGLSATATAQVQAGKKTMPLAVAGRFESNGWHPSLATGGRQASSEVSHT